MPTFRTAGFCVLIAALHATAARAATINIDRTLGPADFTTTRRISDTLNPIGPLYQDVLSTSVSPITLGPGDTIQFHIRLQDPYRFSIAPGAGVQAGFEFLSNAPSSYTNTNLTGSPVTLDNPQNIAANPTSPLAGLFIPFSQPILGLVGATSPANPAQPALFNGFAGSFTLPNDFPTITFDRQSAFEVIGSLNAPTPPPTLAQIVPEPGTLSLLAAAATLLVRRRR